MLIHCFDDCLSMLFDMFLIFRLHLLFLLKNMFMNLAFRLHFEKCPFSANLGSSANASSWCAPCGWRQLQWLWCSAWRKQLRKPAPDPAVRGTRLWWWLTALIDSKKTTHFGQSVASDFTTWPWLLQEHVRPLGSDAGVLCGGVCNKRRPEWHAAVQQCYILWLLRAYHLVPLLGRLLHLLLRALQRQGRGSGGGVFLARCMRHQIQPHKSGGCSSARSYWQLIAFQFAEHMIANCFLIACLEMIAFRKMIA